MIPLYQIPRNTLLWLFATQVMVLLPHIQRTPVWVSVLIAVCMLWRIQVFRGHWSYPKKIIKIPLTLASCVGLVLSFPSFFGLEALVSVLLVGYGLKLLEMYHKRDALVLVYLSFFLVMTGFLFEQGIPLALFNFISVCVIVTVFVGLYQHRGYSYPWRTLRLSIAMVLQAIPLMILMFILLPRFPTFWNMPLQKNSPKTGMSDSMSPGDFTRLTQSSEPVMRIRFQSDTVDAKDMYWRGLVLSRFDGRRWEASEMPYGKPAGFAHAFKLSDNRRQFLNSIASFGLREASGADAKVIRYDVVMEETHSQWIYSLADSIPDTVDIWITYEKLLVKNGYVNNRFKYDAASYPDVSFDPPLPDWQKKLYLKIPENGNPRARDHAQALKNSSASTEIYVNNLLNWFNQDFYYTLNPPLLGVNSVDEFLFDSRKGFCEHFASSFVFMLRAAGIPARVVVGYQGGEYNPYEKYWLVRQYDAHAWAEVWLDGKGWVRYDPTFAVAPQRILDGFRDTFENKGELELPLLSMERYRSSSLLNFMRLQWDSLNYNWTRWVLSYDSERQVAFLTGVFGEYSVARMAAIFTTTVVVLLALMYGLLLWQERDRTRDPLVRAYRRFCKNAKSRGYELQAGETPEVFLQRIAAADPKRYGRFNQLGNDLYQHWYQHCYKQSANDKVVNDKQTVKRLCKQLVF